VLVNNFLVLYGKGLGVAMRNTARIFSRFIQKIFMSIIVGFLIALNAAAGKMVNIVTTDGSVYSSCKWLKDYRVSDFTNNKIDDAFADLELSRKVEVEAVDVGANLVSMIKGSRSGAEVFAVAYNCDTRAIEIGPKCRRERDGAACFEYSKIFKVYERQTEIKNYLIYLNLACDKKISDACVSIVKEKDFETSMAEKCKRGNGKACMLTALRAFYSHNDDIRASKYADLSCKLNYREGCILSKNLKKIKMARSAGDTDLAEKHSEENWDFIQTLGTIEDTYKSF
jgi:hypothetical protein